MYKRFDSILDFNMDGAGARSSILVIQSSVLIDRITLIAHFLSEATDTSMITASATTCKT